MHFELGHDAFVSLDPSYNMIQPIILNIKNSCTLIIAATSEMTLEMTSKMLFHLSSEVALNILDRKYVFRGAHLT